ncbi:MAG: rRNA methyltransferase [Chloroflexi bacterium]|nr:rRNA methyltransferase [Chloroflexota bacterium]MDA1217845.1 rRNA methyltransferase [Chloroflexota bacterium]
MSHHLIIDRFRSARSDPSLVVLEGFHPLKHAIRFGAELIEAVSINLADLSQLAADIAPDTTDTLIQHVKLVPEEIFQQLAPVPPPTGIIAIARRPAVCLTDILDNPAPAPVVLLENPRNHINIGTAIRVAAAAGAAGVITIGLHDPWNAASIITGVGSQFALPVTRATAIPSCERPLVAVDSSGEPLKANSIPPRAILAFGAERSGLSQELLTSADHCIAIPMTEGVSSLNLATAVAVVLYTWRLER